MNAPSPFASLVRQILEAPREETRPWPVNPFPQGPRPGLATERVMLTLLDAYPKWMEHHEIMEAADCSRGGADWGLRYLIERGRIRAIASRRRAGYRRYQAVPLGDGDAS